MVMVECIAKWLDIIRNVPLTTTGCRSLRKLSVIASFYLRVQLPEIPATTTLLVLASTVSFENALEREAFMVVLKLCDAAVYRSMNNEDQGRLSSIIDGHTLPSVTKFVAVDAKHIADYTIRKLIESSYVSSIETYSMRGDKGGVVEIEITPRGRSTEEHVHLAKWMFSGYEVVVAEYVEVTSEWDSRPRPNCLRRLFGCMCMS